MCQLWSPVYTTVAQGWHRTLSMQRLWPLSQDEWGQPTASEAPEASVLIPSIWPLLFQLPHCYHHPLEAQRRGGTSVQRLWPLHEAPRGSTANSTASSPTLLNTESSATTLKAESSLASPGCAGPTITSQASSPADESLASSHLEFKFEPEDFVFTSSSLSPQAGLSGVLRQEPWCALALA